MPQQTLFARIVSGHDAPPSDRPLVDLALFDGEGAPISGVPAESTPMIPAEAVPDCSGDPEATLNALLASLRASGVLASS